MSSLIYMSSSFKKFSASLILLSFMTIVFFSFAVIMHESDGSVSGDCPFSAMGASLCPRNTMAVVFHHISAYQSLINIPVNLGITTLIILLLIASAILTVSINPSLLGMFSLVGILYNSPPDTSYKRKITRWLAFHENSPATP